MKAYINKQLKITLGILPLALTGLVLAGALVLSDKPAQSSALSGSDFQAGRIIDDSVFYNDSSMTVSQIQQFLNARVPNCDTNGDRMHWSGMTRREWAAQSSSRDNPPYTCLKEYTEQIPSVSNSGSDLCTGNISGGNRTAARIIHDVGKACGINPQVLIVMLQKEQSLVTDDWPWEIQYNRAMGYACPDSGPNHSANCNSAYYGFFNQVYNAAQAFKRYEANPTWYNYRAGRNNSILYHPNTSCGSSTVFIENQATANLYIYTPYQPNQAALNNLYGTGNSCSSYGNRNFWRMFNDWFGSTRGNTIEVSGNLKYSPVNPTNEDRVGASFIIKNNENRSITIDEMVVAGRDGNNNNVNFPSVTNITLAPGEKYEYYEHRYFNEPGSHRLWIAVRSPAGEWTRHWPASAKENIIRERTFEVTKIPDITLNQNLKYSPGNLTTEDTVSTSFVIKNNENKKVRINEIVVAARDENNRNVNFKTISNVILQPGEEYQYYDRKKFAKAGEYRLWIAARMPSGVWTRDWPKNVNGSIIRERTFDIAKLPNVSLEGNLKYSPNHPLTGENTATSFIIKNHEDETVTIDEMVVAARDSNNNNVNFPSVTNITLAPGEEYEYYEHTQFDNPGGHRLWIATRLPSGAWTRNWPANASHSIVRDRTFNAKVPYFTLIDSLKHSPVNPTINETMGASFVIRNTESRPVTINEMVVAARDSNNNNVNFPSITDVTIQPGESYTYYEYRAFQSAGEYRLWVAVYDPVKGWYRPDSVNNSVRIERLFTVN